MLSILTTTTHSKATRDEQLFALLDATKVTIATNGCEDVARVGDAFWGTVKECMQQLVLDKGIRYTIIHRYFFANVAAMKGMV